ncbi:MAG: alpha/beta fold hydrolase [Actinomycetia bacterium]|nr:alpha/beta fold hydrolase [Actinomycetes bacterium]
MLPQTQRVSANGIELAYQSFGDPAQPTILLIMGLGTQMIAWPEPMCQALAGLGYHVVRYDNRDVGESTWITGSAPSLAKVALGREQPVYRMSDMADDAVGLLDALGIDQAHVVGASLGGFIAQTVVLAHPDRVMSMSLMMTSTGSKRVGRPKPALARQLMKSRDIPDRAAAIAATVAVFTEISSPGYPIDQAELRRMVSLSFDRGFNPEGRLRQLTAAVVQPNRTKQLGKVAKPTLVMHGLADPLINPSGGLALAEVIPGAKFVGFSGMAHDLPRPLVPTFVSEIAEVAGRAS